LEFDYGNRILVDQLQPPDSLDRIASREFGSRVLAFRTGATRVVNMQLLGFLVL